MNAVCERLEKSKALTHKDPVHVLIGLTWCSVPEFVGTFELILNTERVRHMKSIGTTVIDKSMLEREKVLLSWQTITSNLLMCPIPVIF